MKKWILLIRKLMFSHFKKSIVLQDKKYRIHFVMNKHLISLNYIKYAYAKKKIMYNYKRNFHISFCYLFCYGLVFREINKFLNAFKNRSKSTFRINTWLI